jgi:hypothetical protein
MTQDSATTWQKPPVPVAARSKAYVYGRSPTAITGSSPTEGMNVCLLCVVTRPEESYQLWRVVCDHETSWCEEAITRAGLQSHRNKQTWQKTHCLAATTTDEVIQISDAIFVYFENCTKSRRNLDTSISKTVYRSSVAHPNLYSVGTGDSIPLCTQIG